MIEFFNTKLRNLMPEWPLSDFSASDLQGRTCPSFRHMSEGDAIYSMMRVLAGLDAEEDRLAALEIFEIIRQRNLARTLCFIFQSY